MTFFLTDRYRVDIVILMFIRLRFGYLLFSMPVIVRNVSPLCAVGLNSLKVV